jgi:SHS2 domain-containing protein
VFRWVEHTGELELAIEAPSEREVFEEALAALGELLGERAEEAGQEASFDVTARAPDRATLLAEWLSELVYLAEAERFVPERVESFQLSDDTVDATVGGVRATPPNLVKAVTYHRLEFAPHDGSWRATVVVDV